MNKKIRFLLAMATCLTMAMSATACDWLPWGDPDNGDGTQTEQPGGNEGGNENQGGNEGENNGDEIVGEETENEVGPKATVATADADQLAAFNAEGVNLYDIVNFSSLNTTVTMETAYVFQVTETVEEATASEYANWIADYYVSVDQDVAAGAIGLAGNYGDFGWIAFWSPIDVVANQQIGLLESTGKTAWTYLDVVKSVGTFKCGAFDLDNACEGVTLTVELRLTNPENAQDSIAIKTISYTF